MYESDDNHKLDVLRELQSIVSDTVDGQQEPFTEHDVVKQVEQEVAMRFNADDEWKTEIEEVVSQTLASQYPDTFRKRVSMKPICSVQDLQNFVTYAINSQQDSFSKKDVFSKVEMKILKSPFSAKENWKTQTENLINRTVAVLERDGMLQYRNGKYFFIQNPQQ